MVITFLQYSVVEIWTCFLRLRQEYGSYQIIFDEIE